MHVARKLIIWCPEHVIFIGSLKINNIHFLSSIRNEHFKIKNIIKYLEKVAFNIIMCIKRAWANFTLTTVAEEFEFTSAK